MANLLYLIHSHWWYLVILTGIIAILDLSFGWLSNRDWSGRNRMIALLFPITIDIQFLVGVFLWTVEARWHGYDPIRSWEHPITMVIALVVAHRSFRTAKKETEHSKKFSKAVTGYAFSFLLLTFGIVRVMMDYHAS
jgi:hypothetical protein